MLSVFLRCVQIFLQFCRMLSECSLARWGSSSSVGKYCRFCGMVSVIIFLGKPFNCTSLKRKSTDCVASVSRVVVSPELCSFCPQTSLECCHALLNLHRYLILLLFASKPGLFSPLCVFSSYCLLQTLVCCFSYYKEITPDTIVCTLCSESFLQLILSFSTSGRQNPWNMTITRFASVFVTIGEHQSADMEVIFF